MAYKDPNKRIEYSRWSETIIKARRAVDPEFAAEYKERRKYKNRKPLSMEQKKKLSEHYRKNPNPARERSWRSLGINITCVEYEERLIAQNYCCAICGAHMSIMKKRLHVDHNHKTGSVRGLLCSLCNRGLGAFRDSIEYLQNAISYLKEHP